MNWTAITQALKNFINAFRPMTQTYPQPPDLPVSEVLPPNPIPPTPQPVDLNSDEMFPDWATPAHARHNVRVVCDLEGLSLKDKNDLTACVAQESGFHIGTIHPNYVYVKGAKTLASTDYGICQWNDWYHGKEITPDQALHNPEMAVRLMCKYWKQGLMSQWVSYSSGAYKHFL